MKNVQISPDVTVGETIDGVEHPDPRMRPARLSIRIPALFWERVRLHLERCQSSPGERILWEQWLTPQAVQALLSDSTQTSRFGLTGSDPTVPEPAIRHLRATIRESLQHPLALRLDSGPAGRPGSPAADPSYLLILSNGATVVMRITNTNKPSHDGTVPARLDDCFFTRAAADFARPAGDFASPASPGHSHASAEHPSDENSQGRMRDTVVREWVGRYAVTVGDENARGLVPPDRPCDVNGPALSLSNGSASVGSALRTDSKHSEETVRGADSTARSRVQFLMPTEWGFSGGANGCVWVGYEGSSADASLDPNALRRMFTEAGEDRSGQSSNRNATTTPDSRSRRRSARYPLPLSGESSRSNPSRPNGSRRTITNDALACVPELTRAIEEYPWAWVQAGESQGERPAGSLSDDRAAYRSAIALGRCRLLGSAQADLAELTLAPGVGMSAARELARKLKQWARQTKSLPADMRGATAPRACDLCLGALEARLEAWAAYLAIDESYSAAVDGADASTDAFSEAIDAALDGLAAFDDAIRFAEPLVASVAAGTGTRLLDNWKKLLAAPYRQSPPWWLDCVPPHVALDAEAAW